MFKFSSFHKIIALIALSAAVVMTPANPARADDYSAWKKSLMQKLAEEFRYPKSAVRRGVEGRAKVKLIVAADGSITAHEVTQATGEKVLDRELPKLVARLNPLSALPAGKNSLTVEIPVNWALQ